MRRWLATLGMLAAVVGCSREPSTPAAAAAPPAQAKLGIRPNGDTEIQPDLAKIQSEELKKVFAYIDEHIDEHVVNLQKWIRQPSISNSGEGIPESAEMVKGFFDQLGCQESRVYDVGITEWGATSSSKCRPPRRSLSVTATTSGSSARARATTSTSDLSSATIGSAMPVARPRRQSPAPPRRGRG